MTLLLRLFVVVFLFVTCFVALVFCFLSIFWVELFTFLSLMSSSQVDISLQNLPVVFCCNPSSESTNRPSTNLSPIFYFTKRYVVIEYAILYAT